MKEKYFVSSDGDMPTKIYFSFESAKKDLPTYIDSFDREGNRVQGFKLIYNDQEETNGEYTTDF